jgi:ferredoxin/flavodoxin---NADP+ reductase
MNDMSMGAIDTAAPTQSPEARAPIVSATHHVETVLWVKHWTDQYFSFGITRPASFRFRSGEFVMIGLPGEAKENGEPGKPVLRAYSIASPSYAEELEFFSIKVADGPLTSRLQKIQPGDQILMAKKPVGTLVLDALLPGKRLFLLGTGTGLAPWLSVARDPDVYDAFEKVVVTHCVRETRDLAYRQMFEHDLPNDELFGELAREQLVYIPTVTREDFARQGRITDLIESGRLFADSGLSQARFDPAVDRVMLCGSMAMIKDVAHMLESQGLKEGSNSEPGDFVLERAFVG